MTIQFQKFLYILLITVEPMYKKSQPTNTPSISNNKKPNRNSQPLPLPDKKNESQSDFKSKDEQLTQIIKEHLLLNGYTRTHDTFRTERPNIKARAQIPASRQDPDKNLLLGFFDRGNREQFFKHTGKYWSVDENSRKLEFDLQVYFCIYNVHPHLRRQHTLDNNSSMAFKKYLETRAPEMQLDKEQLILFSMPHMPKPQQNPAFSHLFEKNFITKTRHRLQQFLTVHLRQSSVSQQSGVKKVSTLQEIFYAHHNNSISTSREDFKENCNHSIEMDAIKQQNNELRTIIDSYHKKFDEFAESSKQNLYESNQKWFLFSRQIFNLAKKYIKEDKLKAIQKYQSFFVGNIQQLIQANQISLFDKNSYMNQDLSVNPDVSKQRIAPKKPEGSNASCQLDFGKIKHLFLQANLKDREIEILTVLKSLKHRYTKTTNTVKRREMIIEYSRGDICGIKQDNYIVQKRLFFDGSERIREFYVKLMEAITTDVTGLQYLNKSKKLIQNLVGIFGSERQETRCFRPIVGILQRLSFCREPRLQMIHLGIIPMIFKIFKSQGADISVFTLQFLTAMIMNLSMTKQSKPQFEAHKTQLISIIIDHMTIENIQVRDYINGSIYLLLQSQVLKKQAFNQKLDVLVKNLLETREEDVSSQQYQYILNRLEDQEDGDYGAQESDEEEEAEMEECEDFEDDEEIGSSVSSEDCIEGEIEIANGEQILMKNYALLGPEAVREHILTKSVLDETSKRLNNMTTSINRSRRLDNIFAQKGNATVLEPELSALLNRKR